MPASTAEARVWSTALEVSELFAGIPWVLIGAQMVILLRFVRGDAQVDLLAPDHLGPRADLTTFPPAATTEIPGGTRALATTRLLEVDISNVGAGSLPVPSLAGAIVLKVRAWQARRAARDGEDLVRLLGIVRDVDAVRADMKGPERQALGRVGPLADPTHRAWRVAPDREEARAAFDRLAD